MSKFTLLSAIDKMSFDSYTRFRKDKWMIAYETLKPHERKVRTPVI